MRRATGLLALVVTAATGLACAGTIDGDESGPEGTPTASKPGDRPSGAGGAGSPPPPGGLIDPPKGSPAAAQCAMANAPVAPRLVRLTRLQYENSVRDLTGLDVRPSRDLHEDPVYAGFDRGLELEVGELVSRVYRDTAESVARQ